MRIRECMTKNVAIASPSDTLCEAALKMADCDAGVLPVGEDDRLVGMITDRDIAIRAVARRLGPDTPIRDVMSKEVLYCFEDEDVRAVAENMGDQQVRRLPVLSRDKRLVGIVSLGDVAQSAVEEIAGHAIASISRRGGRHDQALH